MESFNAEELDPPYKTVLVITSSWTDKIGNSMALYQVVKILSQDICLILKLCGAGSQKSNLKFLKSRMKPLTVS